MRQEWDALEKGGAAADVGQEERPADVAALGQYVTLDQGAPTADGTIRNSRIWLKGKPYRLTPGLRDMLSYLLGKPGISEKQVIINFGMSGSSHLHKRLKDLRNKLAKELKKSGWRLSIKTEATCISCKWEEAK